MFPHHHWFLLPIVQFPLQPVINQAPFVNFQAEKPKPKRIVLKIVGAIVLVIVLLMGYLLYQGTKNGPQVSQTVTNFLTYVSDNDLESAYELTGSQFKEEISMQEFQKFISSTKAQYSDFQEQKQTGFTVKKYAGQPTKYVYSGKITYADGETGELSATLVKENNEWKILSVNVEVGVKRLEKFQQTGGQTVLGVSTDK